MVEVAPQYDATTNTAHAGAQMLFEIASLMVFSPSIGAPARDLRNARLTAASKGEGESGAPPPWAPLAGMIAAVSVYAIAQGLTYPLLSFVLARQGHSPARDRSLRSDDADRLHLLRAVRPAYRATASARIERS